MTRSWGVLGGLAVGALLLGGWSWKQSQGPSAVVAEARFRERLIARGEVVAREGVAEVRARSEGRVLSVLVREGEFVQEGQLLAELDADLARVELQRRQAESSALAANAEAVTRGARPEERQAAEAESRAAEAALAVEQDRLGRTRALHASGAVSEAAFQELVLSVQAAEARVEAARARRDLFRAGGRAEDVRAASSRLEASRAAGALAQTELAKARIVAPKAGVVLSRSVDPGDTISLVAGGLSQPLFEIADPGALEVRVEVEELDALRVQAGLPVTLTAPGGGRGLGEGKVSRVSPRVQRRGLGLEDARSRGDGLVRPLWVEVGAGLALPLGQRLEAVISLPEMTVPKALPRGAVSVRDGQAWVRVRRGWGVQETPVLLGAGDAALVEVRGPLELGDAVELGAP